MKAFQYEEQGEKKYLVYQKRDGERLDMFTMEMLSNNKIPGLVPFSYIQIDQSVTMKYNVTGLVSLAEYLENTVKKEQFLKILVSLCDAVMQAEDYMLDISAYVFDEDRIFVDSKETKACMVVLPVEHEGVVPTNFFKKLLFNVKYDQTEDCSYVASLMTLLRDDSEFSFQTFSEQVKKYKKVGEFRKRAVKEVPNGNSQLSTDRFSEHPTENGRNTLANKGKNSDDKTAEERKEWLDILFSGEKEEPEKKRKGLFSQKDKKEGKKGKGVKHFFEKKKEKEEEKDFIWKQEENPLRGLAIPGLDAVGKAFGNEESLFPKRIDKVAETEKEPIPVPAQKVNILQIKAEQHDFGATEYYEEDLEDTLMIGQEEETCEKRFILYRYKTQETFELSGDVIRIGRSPSISEVCLSGNRGIGRTHAILYIRNGDVYIADNNSKNKTFVDGEQIKAGEQPKRLLSGAKIRLGDEELEFRILS